MIAVPNLVLVFLAVALLAAHFGAPALARFAKMRLAARVPGRAVGFPRPVPIRLVPSISTPPVTTPQSVALALVANIVSLPPGANPTAVHVLNPYAGSAPTAGDAHQVHIRIELYADKPGPGSHYKSLYFYGDDPFSLVQSQLAAATALLPGMLAGTPDPAAHAAVDRPNFPQGDDSRYTLTARAGAFVSVVT
jgi:hypothetical protein